MGDGGPPSVVNGVVMMVGVLMYWWGSGSEGRCDGDGY